MPQSEYGDAAYLVISYGLLSALCAVLYSHSERGDLRFARPPV